MMKVDVEGHEDAFILGAAQTIRSESLKIIEIESYGEGALAFLTDCGFERAYYNPRSHTLESKPSKGPPSNDVFVRDREFVAARLRDARSISVFGRRY